MEVINPHSVSGEESVQLNKLHQTTVNRANVRERRLEELEQENNSLRNENLYLKNRIAKLEADLAKLGHPSIDLLA